MKTLKRYIRSGRRKIYTARQIPKTDIMADDTFGDPDDMLLPDNIEDAFNEIINKLREYGYEEFVDKLDDLIDDPKIHALLSEGFGDGDLVQVHMSSSAIALPVMQLLPSQSEIGLDNSLKFPLKSDCSIYFNSPVTVVAPVLTYRKTFIIDGHHRWSQTYIVNPEATISALNFNYNSTSPFRALRNFQGAIAVAKGDIRKEYSKVNNLYEMDKGQIEAYIDEHMEDICWQSLAEHNVCDSRDSAIEYLTLNSLQLKNENPPFSGAPDREYMPQTDTESISVADAGQTDI